MKYIKTMVMALFLAVIAGCATTGVSDESLREGVDNYKGYRPIDPLPVSTVKHYDATANKEVEVYWASIASPEAKRNLLPIQSSKVVVKRYDQKGKLSYLTAGMSDEKGQYTVVMDYMKYRVQEVRESSGKFIGNGRVGVGLRIQAEVSTSKKKVNLGSILSLGVEAEKGNISGGISIDVIGIDSEGVTNLIPMTTEIDQTAIQGALQALASVKAKLWDKDVTITPHLIATTDTTAENEGEVRKLGK